MKLIFVSGPYRGDIDGNIARARVVAISLWKQGYAVICPHLNTAHFDGYCPDKVWLDGDMEIMARCDIVYMMRDWRDSVGARKEHEVAHNLGMEIIYELR